MLPSLEGKTRWNSSWPDWKRWKNILKIVCLQIFSWFQEKTYIYTHILHTQIYIYMHAYIYKCVYSNAALIWFLGWSFCDVSGGLKGWSEHWGATIFWRRSQGHMDMVDTSFFLLGHFFPQRYAVHVELHVSSSFPSAEWRNKMQKEKKRKEQEKLWLQDKLLTSTYNTGPDGLV